MDMSKLATADKIVLGAAGFSFIWTFFPVWYKCCSILGESVDLGTVSGFRGVLILSWLLSIAAIAEIVLTKMMGMSLNLPMARGMVHLGIAAVAGLFVLLGLVSKSTGLTVSWGYFLGLLAAIAWVYGAYMMYSQPAEAKVDEAGPAAPSPPPAAPSPPPAAPSPPPAPPCEPIG
jgi:Na+-translocating ferredoxin:NAD+ oxidoreductase RnfA subunit